MVNVRKTYPGTDNFGHVWESAGDVVDMPYEEAAQLVAIPDGGFTIVPDPAPEPETNPNSEQEPEKTDIEEPGPADTLNEAPASKRRGRPPRNRTEQAAVEEQ